MTSTQKHEGSQSLYCRPGWRRSWAWRWRRRRHRRRERSSARVPWSGRWASCGATSRRARRSRTDPLRPPFPFRVAAGDGDEVGPRRVGTELGPGLGVGPVPGAGLGTSGGAGGGGGGGAGGGAGCGITGAGVVRGAMDAPAGGCLIHIAAAAPRSSRRRRHGGHWQLTANLPVPNSVCSPLPLGVNDGSPHVQPACTRLPRRQARCPRSRRGR